MTRIIKIDFLWDYSIENSRYLGNVEIEKIKISVYCVKTKIIYIYIYSNCKKNKIKFHQVTTKA